MAGPKISPPLYKRDRDRLAAQVARLEGQNEAMAAALEPFAGYANQVSETVPDDAPYPYHPPMVVLRKARAALSDAGKGWAEVREQVRVALEVLKRRCEMASSWSDELARKLAEDLLSEIRDALDALKGVK